MKILFKKTLVIVAILFAFILFFFLTVPAPARAQELTESQDVVDDHLGDEDEAEVDEVETDGKIEAIEKKVDILVGKVNGWLKNANEYVWTQILPPLLSLIGIVSAIIIAVKKIREARDAYRNVAHEYNNLESDCSSKDKQIEELKAENRELKENLLNMREIFSTSCVAQEQINEKLDKVINGNTKAIGDLLMRHFEVSKDE